LLLCRIFGIIKAMAIGKRRKNNDLEFNQFGTTLAVFMETYNKSVPSGFPHVSIQILRQFQELHPILFRNGDEWSIDRHRKRVMDWLPSHIGAL